MAPGELDLAADLAYEYGLTSLNKVLLVTSVCDDAGVDLRHFTEQDLAGMRTATRHDRRAGGAHRPGSAGVSWVDLARAAQLENDAVLLRPVRTEDRAGVHAVAMDPDIWRYFVSRVETRGRLRAGSSTPCSPTWPPGRRIPYVVIHKASGRDRREHELRQPRRGRRAPGDRLVLARAGVPR